MNILTIDVEEPWHTIPRRAGYKEACQPHNLEGFFDRFRQEIDLADVTPVLFWVGTVAERHKNLVRALEKDGFIIASHGYDHEDCARLSRPDLQNSLKYARHHLEDILGGKVTAFRAPAFSIGPVDDFWSSLAESGFRYDFSICDAKRMAGGGHQTGIKVPSSITRYGLTEFPMSLSRVFGRNWYVTGGGYFRICPSSVLKIVQSKKSYNMFYLHPIDFMRPRFTAGDPRSLGQKFRQSVSWGDSWKKMTEALAGGNWHSGDMKQWIQSYE